MAKVSIIIPVYNTENYLCQCLDSVVNQTFTDIEIICLNDGSTDGSLSILEEYAQKDSRIKVINKENGGLSSARNTGLDNITGEYVYFLDSDDYIEPNILEKAMDIFSKNDIDYYCFGSEAFQADKCVQSLDRINNYLKIKRNGYCNLTFKIGFNTNIQVWNKVFKTSLIKEHNIRFIDSLLYEDIYFMWHYFFLSSSAYFDDEIYHYYRVRSASIMEKTLTNKNSKAGIHHLYNWRELFLSLSKDKEFIQKHFDELFYLLKIYIKTALDTVEHKDKKEVIELGKQYEKETFRLCPEKKFIYRMEQVFSFKKSIATDQKILTICGIKLKTRGKLLTINGEEMNSGLSEETILFKIKNVWQNIFSIIESENKHHLIITILGFKIKIKRYSISLLVDLFRKNYPNYISLGIILKDEAKDIKEWIEYHRLIGVEKFYIYDDNSMDNIKDVLKPYIEKGIVDYKHWTVNAVNRQVEAYNDLIKRCKYQTRWLGFIDVDEFILPIEKDNLKDFLKSYEKYSGVGINWMCFDSNGHKKRPDGLVIENYTRIHKNRELFYEEYHIKSIVNPRLVNRAEVHHCDFYTGYLVDEDMKPIKKQKFPKGHFLEKWNSKQSHLKVDCEAKKIIINHYWSKSKEDYMLCLQKGFATHEAKRIYKEKRLNFSEYTYNTCIVDKYSERLKNRMNKEV